MAADLYQLEHTEEEEEEDYIDIEVSSTSNLLSYTKSTSAQHANEFEFQMFSSSSERETSSPADELFYKGKLLPLHLPPRLQMFEKLLRNSSPYNHNTQNFEDEHFKTPLTTTAYTTPAENTPFESCNISPLESPHVSKELNPDEYFSAYSKEAVSFTNENPKKSWTKKLKLGSKLKASHAYLKSFFNKSISSDQSSARKSYNELAPKAAEATEKTPFGQIKREKYQAPINVSKSLKNAKTIPEGISRHRRSFSGAIRRFSMTKSILSPHSFGSSSSLSSGNSTGLSDSSYLKRCGSARSDVESSIQGAIAHCKRSQQDFRLRKAVNEVGFYTLSSSGLIGYEVQDRPVLCRG